MLQLDGALSSCLNVIALRSANHVRRINKFCGQNAEIPSLSKCTLKAKNEKYSVKRDQYI